jgi:hypothetical protein
VAEFTVSPPFPLEINRTSQSCVFSTPEFTAESEAELADAREGNGPRL